MTKRFAVVDEGGSGWGRYATHAEAEARAENLRFLSTYSRVFEVFELVGP